MASRENYVQGVLRERWDWTGGTYTSWNAAGQQVSQRALTPAEQAIGAADVAAETSSTNRKTLEDGLLASVAALKANVDALNTVIGTPNATINSSPASYIKDVARADKDATRAAIRLAKIALTQFQDTDTGSA